jgi:carbamoyltransferase
MDAFGLKDITEIDYFVMDWIGAKRLINSNPAYRKLETDYIFSKLNVAPDKFIFAESHHLAHAASAYYPSGFQDAAVLVVDGVGSDMETISLYHARGNGITFLERSRFYGLGHLYTMVTKRLLGFGTGEEGKTMGLAPYGRNVKKRVLECQGEYRGLHIDYSQFLDRMPDSEIRQPNLVPCPKASRVTEDYYARLAYDVQEELERAMLHLARYAAERTGSANLCLAGGVALNCVANGKILEARVFEKLFVQPAASDTGMPYGLALLGYHQLAGGQGRGRAKVYTGVAYPKAQIIPLLKQFGIPYRATTNRTVAQLLAAENIVGWLTGGSEIGPRALGHRSILADPRNVRMKDLLNKKVKHREAFRPFAPSVLCEYAREYFELSTESPYMLLASRVLDHAVGKIPAVVHVDQTARVQTVSADDCPVYHDLLVQFHKLTGIPVLLNTSFNDNGEPIVETPLDGLLCFMRTRMDYLVMEGILIEKAKIGRRTTALVKRLSVYRDRLLQDQYKDALGRCCRGYRVDEMRRYLAQEEIKGRYHASYKAQDLLEEKLWQWVGKSAQVTLICDNEHLRLLQSLEPYSRLRVAEVVLVEDDATGVTTLDLDEIGSPDAVLICLYNVGDRVHAKVKAVFQGEAYAVYEPSSRKLTRAAVVPARMDTPNGLDGLTWISNEARREKNWEGFFARLSHGQGQP